MSKTDTLNKFISDLEKWAHDLKSKWSDIGEIHQLNSSDHTKFQSKLNQIIDQINEVKSDASKLDNDSATKLKDQAVILSEMWNDLISKKRKINVNRAVPIGEHELPPLPYPYNALEPTINERIMRLHHTKHHKSYVDGLNKAEKEMEKARRSGDFSLIKHWEREAAFNGAGHYLHTIFWNVMSPKGGGRPTGNLLKEINKTFGSFEKFKRHFSEAAKNVEGVGWAILIWSPRSHRLEILQAEKHQHLTQWDVIPILVLDVWEHAYYLQYENDKGKYVDNWWNIVNWNAVSDRFKEAQKVKWKPY